MSSNDATNDLHLRHGVAKVGVHAAHRSVDPPVRRPLIGLSMAMPQTFQWYTAPECCVVLPPPPQASGHSSPKLTEHGCATSQKVVVVHKLYVLEETHATHAPLPCIACSLPVVVPLPVLVASYVCNVSVAVAHILYGYSKVF